MKKIKKITCTLLIVIIMTVTFVLPPTNNVHAKTLRDLKAELADAQARYQSGKSDRELTEKQIADKRNKVNEINREIDKVQQEIIDLGNEIEQLEIDIQNKEKEIKQIMNYYQLSSGESAYLEYAFNAADFTDFIYRMAISEQLSSYNDKLVDEYNQMIEDNKAKQKDLQNKTVALNAKQVELEKELNDLGSHLSDVLEINVSIEDEIKSLKELIDTYENVYNCSLDDNLDTCTAKQLPIGTQFYRPVISGRVSSNYGGRTYWLNGKQVTDYHYGIDFASPHGTDVYAIANGRVAWITRKASCGGNMVYIHHTVNGKDYTSGYFHLATINVSVGDVVTYNTVIGTVGGVPSIETWDGCSSGAHVHLQMSTTHIEEKEGFYTRFTARRLNPREVVNIPSLGTSITSRTTMY